MVCTARAGCCVACSVVCVARMRTGAAGLGERPSENYAVEFLGSREGLELNKAFARIGDLRIRRAIVELIRSLASESGNS